MTSATPSRANPELVRNLFELEHNILRANFRRFLQKEIQPNEETWRLEGIIPREIYRKAGAAGFVGPNIPEEYGGIGPSDYRFSVVLAEECGRIGARGFGGGIGLHNDIALPYLLHDATEEQRARWFPGLASGDLLLALAMTEPGGGSDLAALTTNAVRDGDHFVVNGAKTFITNGINSDLVIVAVRTQPNERHRGLSLLVVESDTPGFHRGRNLEKIGLHSQDTAELFFDDARVPVQNLLGEENGGFYIMTRNLAQERLGIAVVAVAAARAALEMTLAYVKEREAFGHPIGQFQHVRFELAEVRTEVEIAQVFIDRCTLDHVAGNLSPEQAAMAKWWCSELQGRVLDKCLQFHGGYGYMAESAIAQSFTDARITRIFGGTTEIMKEIISKADGLM